MKLPGEPETSTVEKIVFITLFVLVCLALTAIVTHFLDRNIDEQVGSFIYAHYKT